jgi:hypothetical protein
MIHVHKLGLSSTVANTNVFATTATRSRERYDAFSQLDAETVDDTIREWLRDFVDDVGLDVARELLQGAGQVEFVS